MQKRHPSLRPLLLALLLLTVLWPAPAHAGGVSFSGSNSLRSGDRVTVVCSISGSHILAIEGDLSYDQSALELLGTECLLGGDWRMQQNGNHLLLRDNSLETPLSGTTSILSVTFRVKSGAEPGSSVSAAIRNVMVSDGDSDTDLGGDSWGADILRPLSSNSRLVHLGCGDGELVPAFDPSVTRYHVDVPFSVDHLSLSTEADHSGATVSVDGNNLSVGENTVTVTVTAEDGSARRYSIAVTREQDPNYVPSDDAHLASLKPSRGRLSPRFDDAVTDYVVYVPYETTSFRLSAVARDARAQDVDGGSTRKLKAGDNLMEVRCTAEDGETSRTYRVHVWRMPLYAGTLPEIIPPENEAVPAPAPEPDQPTEKAPAPADLVLPATTLLFGRLPVPTRILIAAVALLAAAALAALFWLMGRRGALESLEEADSKPVPPPVPEPETAPEEQPADLPEETPEETPEDGTVPLPAEAPAAPAGDAPAFDEPLIVAAVPAAYPAADFPAAEPEPDELEDEPLADEALKRDFLDLGDEDEPVPEESGEGIPVRPENGAPDESAADELRAQLKAQAEEDPVPDARPSDAPEVPLFTSEDAPELDDAAIVQLTTPITETPAPVVPQTVENPAAPENEGELHIPSDLSDADAVARLAQAMIHQVLPERENASKEDPLHGMTLDELLRDIENM